MITQFSATPSRQRPATFAAEMDQFLSELARFVGEANSLEQSLQLVATTGTSTTTLTVATSAVTGNITISTQAGKAWAVGSWVYVCSAASTANVMHGQVVSYNSASGALVVNVQAVVGAGTYSAWVIGLAVAQPASMALPGVLDVGLLRVDADFRLDISGGRPKLVMGNDDWMDFDRANNLLSWVVQGATRMGLSSANGLELYQDAATANGVPRLSQVNLAVAAATAKPSAAQAQAMADSSLVMTPLSLAQAFQGGNQSLSGSGYQRLPGGLLLQWGELAGGYQPPVSLSVSFPLYFPAACYSVVVGSSFGAASSVTSINKSQGGFGFYVDEWSGINNAGGLCWFALGR